MALKFSLKYLCTDISISFTRLQSDEIMSGKQGVDISQNRMKARVKTNNKDNGGGGLAVVRRLTGGGRQREAMERVANEMALANVNPTGGVFWL